MGKKWTDIFPRTQLCEESLNITNQGNGNQNHNEILSIIMALSKRREIISIGEDVEKGNTYTLLVHFHSEKHYRGSSKIKNKTTI